MVMKIIGTLYIVFDYMCRVPSAYIQGGHARLLRSQHILLGIPFHHEVTMYTRVTIVSLTCSCVASIIISYGLYTLL